jgi:hypothetical protein
MDGRGVKPEVDTVHGEGGTRLTAEFGFHASNGARHDAQHGCGHVTGATSSARRPSARPGPARPWTYSSPQLYELLVLIRGWSLERYSTFLADAMIAALLPLEATKPAGRLSRSPRSP